MTNELTLIAAEDRHSLIQIMEFFRGRARGLPIVLGWNGPWAVIWPFDYSPLTLELPCCKVHLDGPEALPGESVKCPHGKYMIRYV
jgi:hypothetical protein